MISETFSSLNDSVIILNRVQQQETHPRNIAPSPNMSLITWGTHGAMHASYMGKKA